MSAWTNICHNLIFRLSVPVPPHNPHADWLIAQRWIHEVYDQEGLAFLGNVRTVLIFQLVLRLIGVEMHNPLTNPPQARVVFPAHTSMRRGYARVVQYGKKHEPRRTYSCHVHHHGRTLLFGTLR